MHACGGKRFRIHYIVDCSSSREYNIIYHHHHHHTKQHYQHTPQQQQHISIIILLLLRIQHGPNRNKQSNNKLVKGSFHATQAGPCRDNYKDRENLKNSIAACLHDQGQKHEKALHFSNAAKKDIENSIVTQAYLSAYDKGCCQRKERW